VLRADDFQTVRSITDDCLDVRPGVRTRVRIRTTEAARALMTLFALVLLVLMLRAVVAADGVLNKNKTSSDEVTVVVGTMPFTWDPLGVCVPVCRVSNVLINYFTFN
jgi:hypothetical protein